MLENSLNSPLKVSPFRASWFCTLNRTDGPNSFNDLDISSASVYGRSALTVAPLSSSRTLYPSNSAKSPANLASSLEIILNLLLSIAVATALLISTGLSAIASFCSLV